MRPSEPVRICYAVGSLDIGGTEGQLVQLVLGLDRQRFQPSVVCLTHEGALAGRVREAGITVKAVPPPSGARWSSVHWIRELRRHLESERVHVAHGFLFPTYSLLAVAAARSRCSAIVSGVRSLGLGPERHWTARLLERSANRLTDRIVANSEAVRRAVLARDPRAQDRLDVIYNGVELERFAREGQRREGRRRLGLDDQELLVVCVANLIAYKGHDDLLRAFAELRRRRPRARLALAGAGPEHPRLQERARELGLDGSLQFLGHHPDVPLLLAASDIAVQASHQEGFPNAILEAMAAARPVVATAVGGVMEQVVRGLTGLLVEPGNVEAMTDALEQLAVQRDLREEMGRGGRRRAEELFTWPRTLESYQSLYRALLN